MQANSMRANPNREPLAREAKAIVALAFRNGPIENVHAGKLCPVCEGQPEFSHITDSEMKLIMKTAVDRIYELLCLRSESPVAYESRISFGEQYTTRWDDPSPLDDHGNRSPGTRPTVPEPD
jgi:hypothetical protein